MTAAAPNYHKIRLLSSGTTAPNDHYPVVALRSGLNPPTPKSPRAAEYRLRDPIRSFSGK